MENISLWDPDPARRYIPASLSEIADQLLTMIGGAPTFRNKSDPYENIDSEFEALIQGFAIIRTKLGEDQYTALSDLAARAKALFEQDPDESNGKTMEGIKLIWEMQDIVQSVRKRRVVTKQADGEGEITGD